MQDMKLTDGRFDKIYKGRNAGCDIGGQEYYSMEMRQSRSVYCNVHLTINYECVKIAKHSLVMFSFI